MLLSDFMFLTENIFSNSAEPYSIIQKAYEDCVKKIKLHQQAFVAVIDSAAGLDGFNNKHQIICGSKTSEIAFKEMHSIIDVSFSGGTTKAYSVNPMIVGKWTDSNFRTDIGFVADETFSWVGSDLVPVDREIAKVEITGYPFPYFCYTVNSPEVDEHRYDIQWMVDTYGDQLVVDDFVGVMTVIKAKALYLMSEASINEASNIETYYDQLLNAYNENLENFFVHGFEVSEEQVTRFG